MTVIVRWVVQPAVRVALVAALLLLIFVGWVLTNFNWDPMAFVMAGTRFSQLDPAGTKGYDGQYAFYMARDPLNSLPHIDMPTHRYQRILYPVLAWGLSGGGQPVLLPWMMLLINLVATSAAVGLLAQLLFWRAASPWYALVLIFYIGQLFALRADLNEPLAITLSLAGWLVWEKDRLRPAVVLFALAGLAKEVGLVIPAGLVAWELIRQNWRRAALLAVGSFRPYLVVFGLLRVRFDAVAAVTTPSFIPFSGIRHLKDPVNEIVAAIWVISPAIVAGVWALLDLRRKTLFSAQGHVIVLVLAQVALVAMMPRPTWEDPLAVLRTGIGPLAVLRTGIGPLATILVWLAAYHPRMLPYAAVLWVPSGLLIWLAPG